MPLLRIKHYSWIRILVVAVIIGIVAALTSIIFDIALLTYMRYVLGSIVGYKPPIPELGELEENFKPIRNWYLIPVVVAIGGFISGLIAYSLAPEAEGDGTDTAIAAFHRFNGIIRRRVPVIKLVSNIFTIGSGGSAGREGPMAQIGAGIGSAVADFLHLGTRIRRIALAAGMGAGLGTIFKAPLGGALFGAEALYKRDFETEALVPAIIASVVGYSIFGFFTGYRHVIPIPSVIFSSPLELVFYAVLGIVAGIFGILYAKSFYFIQNLFKEFKLPKYIKPALGGLLTGSIGLLFPQILEVGYGWITTFIHGKYPLMYLGTWVFSESWYVISLTLLVLAVLKILATSLTVGSGGSGGVFAPGLFIGASIGASLGIAFTNLFPTLISNPDSFIISMVVIGMMAFFGGVSKSPIAVIVMVSEMTGSYELLAPSMLATTLAYLITGKHTIYSEQVPLREDSPAHVYDYIVLRKVRVKDVMRKDIPVLSPETSPSEALSIMALHTLRGLPVVKDSKVVGMVSYEDLKIKVDPDDMDRIKVGDVMTKKLVVTYPDETVYDAFNRMLEYDVAQLPVIDRDSGKFIGLITRKDVRRAYDVLLSRQMK